MLRNSSWQVLRDVSSSRPRDSSEPFQQKLPINQQERWPDLKAKETNLYAVNKATTSRVQVEPADN